MNIGLEPSWNNDDYWFDHRMTLRKTMKAEMIHQGYGISTMCLPIRLTTSKSNKIKALPDTYQTCEKISASESLAREQQSSELHKPEMRVDCRTVTNDKRLTVKS